MTRGQTRTLAGAAALAALFAAAPVAAGSPDDPGRQGDLIADSRDRAVELADGARNGWGQRVAGFARGDMPDRYGSVGKYLKTMSGGPNPENDNGDGND